MLSTEGYLYASITLEMWPSVQGSYMLPTEGYVSKPLKCGHASVQGSDTISYQQRVTVHAL